MFSRLHWCLPAAIALFAAPMPAPAQAQNAAPSAPADAPASRETIDAQIRRHMADGGLVGLAAVIILDGEVVWSGSYGFADRERATPFTTDTVMNIASISKTVVGVAMMRAIEQGLLSLDADINTYLPFAVRNPHRPEQPITLRQLATHTSGITDRPEVYERSYHYGGDAPEPLGDFLAAYLVPGGRDFSPENFVDAAPGTRREYSNIGAGLAGYIIERATGRPLNLSTREQIFAPLGMTRTRWFMSEAPMDDHATLYVRRDGTASRIEPYGLTTWPDGGLRTSVNDLSRFFIALLNGGQHDGVQILSPESTAEMQRFHYTPEHRPDNVVLAEDNSGLFWRTKFDVTYVGHGGNDPGVGAEMLANLSKDTGVVLLTNTSGDGAFRAHWAITRALFAHADVLRRASPNQE